MLCYFQLPLNDADRFYMKIYYSNIFVVFCCDLNTSLSYYEFLFFSRICLISKCLALRFYGNKILSFMRISIRDWDFYLTLNEHCNGSVLGKLQSILE